ncbi:MAG TPA: hypothetical protein VF733_05855 [Candidatus Saccharimonadales bacterium]
MKKTSEGAVMDHDIDALAKKIRGLVVEIDRLAGDDRWNIMLEIIYKKGWTTPAEFRLVSGIVENMQEQVAVLGKLQTTLVAGSKAVLQKQIRTK